MIYIIVQTDCDDWGIYDTLENKILGYVDSEEQAIKKCLELDKQSKKYFTWNKIAYPKFSWEEIKHLQGE